MDKGIIVLLVSLTISISLLFDSIISWSLLADAPKPLNNWYISFASLLVSQSALCLFVRVYRNNIPNKCKRAYECFQFMFWIMIIGWLPIGYSWLITTWYYSELAIPIRLKVEFLTILIGFTCLLLPVVIISIYTAVRVIIYLNGVRNRAMMRHRLEDLYSKMYDPKFSFVDIEHELNIEFYQFPLKEKEIRMIHDEFSVALPEDKEKSEGCSICYTGFKKEEVMTTIPICGHQFHFDCIELWLKTQSSCPCCRSIIRKNMIEHFHGCVQIKNEENSKKPNNLDEEIINEISINVSKSRINTHLVSSSEKC